jgi:single-strand DNA-binding protein
MKRSENFVLLIGNAGGDPQLKTDKNGKTLATFSLATTEGYLPQGSKEWVNLTTWHNIVVFKDAQMMCDLIRKGDCVTVVGKIENRTVGEGDQRKTYSSVVCRTFTVQPKVERQDQGQDNVQQNQNDIPEGW